MEPSAVDMTTIRELRENTGGDPEFLAELIDEFIDDAPAQLEAMRAALGSGDATGARRAAHTLKGNSRTFGATSLATLCQDAEHAAAAGDLDAVRDRLAGIDQGWARVRAELLVLRDGRAF